MLLSVKRGEGALGRTERNSRGEALSSPPRETAESIFRNETSFSPRLVGKPKKSACYLVSKT